MASKAAVPWPGHLRCPPGSLHFLHSQCSAAADQQREVFTGMQKHEVPNQTEPASCPRAHLASKIPCIASILTNISQALHSNSKAFGARQQVVFEAGQPLGLGHLHADLVFLLCEPCALTVDQELKSKRMVTREDPTLTQPQAQPEATVPKKFIVTLDARSAPKCPQLTCHSRSHSIRWSPTEQP